MKINIVGHGTALVIYYSIIYVNAMLGGFYHPLYLSTVATSEKLALMIKDLKDSEPERFQVAMAQVPRESALWTLFPQGL